jgi:N-acetylmuramoyl-L-alanine amidase
MEVGRRVRTSLAACVLVLSAACTPAPVVVSQPVPPPPLEQAQAIATVVPTAAPVVAATPVPTAVLSTPPAAGIDAACDGENRFAPLPAPGSASAQNLFRSFREPLAAAPLFAAPGPKRVGLQAGHWLTNQVPAELRGLQNGASGGGKDEWEVNLDVARRAAALLEADGIEVDVLPSTVPPHYQAHVFVALHADGDPAGAARGFKIARPGFSSIPNVDDRLVDTLNGAYETATALPRDDERISLRMRYYYAFNSRRYCHAVARGVPQAIVEMGYLTSAVDRRWLIGDPDRLARGVADGIWAFLKTQP